MRNDLSETTRDRSNAKSSNERGSALVISLFVLALMTVFVALALSRTAAEANAVGNETAEARTLYAAQGSLEMMTRNFNKVFELKLNPSAADLTAIRTAAVPGLGGYTFNQELDQTSARQTVTLTGGPYSGLFAIRDNWRIRTTATDNQGVQVQLTRNILNSRVPIFQFGVFYEDDLELFNGPPFAFGGRVHTNRHFFLHPSDQGALFDSRVTAAGHIVTQTKRNGDMPNLTTANIKIKNASGVYQTLLPSEGSVLNGSPNVLTPDLPSSAINNNFATQTAKFDGNLQAQTRVLRLPLKLGNAYDLVEILRRPKTVATAAGGDLFKNLTTGAVEPVTAASMDGDIMQSERYANKPGIRISMADSKERLPGCASGTGTTSVTFQCGIRLDGAIDGLGSDRATTGCLTGDRANPCVRGYRPLPMKNAAADATFNHQATRVNGERFYMGSIPGRGVWIKVELVSQDAVTQAIITRDITADFLSLGITEQATRILDSSGTARFDITDTRYDDTAPTSSITATSAQTASTGTDSRSIIKLQRFIVKGPRIPNGTTTYMSWFDMSGGVDYNFVERFSGVDNQTEVNGACASGCSNTGMDAESILGTNESNAHLFRATVGNNIDRAIVPFPITMFDSREGQYYDERSTTYYTDLAKLPRNGVMSMVDIDVANLRRFFRGDFNGLLPTSTAFASSNGGVGLRNSDVPQREGWVIYVSDRRGDDDYDGELDMEDIYSNAPGNGGTMQPGEDVNFDGILNASYGTASGGETERYNTNVINADLAAVQNHKYYRRGVRLINAATVPGIFDSATPANTRGVSFASENGIYTLGNFNATGIGTVPATGNSTFDQYMPYNTATHIPASIVGDAVTILSNAWNDAQSFLTPTNGSNHGGRQASDTQIRFAMIAGDPITSLTASPNQGGGDPRLNGGVHNFKRFLEDWGGNRLDYTGSLINLFNSRNNNGSFKCCNTVYSPPRRNWVFDSTFLDPTRMPPGTPFFQYVQTTGFQRTNS